ncbi:MAG: hypothetical protein QW587_04810 [Candidatus Bathyarchaeia archaeon]
MLDERRLRLGREQPAGFEVCEGGKVVLETFALNREVLEPLFKQLRALGVEAELGGHEWCG